MNIYLEFVLSIALALFVSMAMRAIIWHEMALVMAIISGLLGGLAGWLQGALLVDHLDWFIVRSSTYREVVIGISVVLFVGGFQRLLSKQIM